MTAESVGVNCAAGGQKVQAFQDFNNNGVYDHLLGENLLGSPSYICNGNVALAVHMVKETVCTSDLTDNTAGMWKGTSIGGVGQAWTGAGGVTLPAAYRATSVLRVHEYSDGSLHIYAKIAKDGTFGEEYETWRIGADSKDISDIRFFAGYRGIGLTSTEYIVKYGNNAVITGWSVPDAYAWMLKKSVASACTVTMF